MLLKITLGKSVKEANSNDNVDWEIFLPKFFALENNEQIVVAFASDVEHNPVALMELKDKSEVIAEKFGLERDFVTDILVKVGAKESNKFSEAAEEYTQYQNLPEEKIYYATSHQVNKIATQINNAEIKFSDDKDDKMFERFLSWRKQSLEAMKDLKEMRAFIATEEVKALHNSMIKRKKSILEK